MAFHKIAASLLFYEILFICLVQVELRLSGRRLVGGHNAPDGSTPFVVSIQHNLRHICGGSIISDLHILTSAHCIKTGTDSKNYSQYSVMVGSVFIDEGERVEVKNLQVHPDYKLLINDVGIVELSKKLTFSKKIEKLSLPTQAPKSKDNCTSYGWGLTKLVDEGSTTDNETANHDGTDISSINPENDTEHRGSRNFTRQLQASHVVLDETELCYKTYDVSKLYPGMDIKKTEPWLCVGPNQIIACEGDSGGPLVCNKEVMGTISFGQGCSAPEAPLVYSNVIKFKPWIDSIIKDASKDDGSGKKPKSSANQLVTTALGLKCLVLFHLLMATKSLI